MNIHFAEPQWVHLLWGVIVFVALLVWLERGRGDAVQRFIGAAALQARLISTPTRTQRAARIVFLGLAGVFLTLALMRPQWGLELVQSERAGAEIMVCLDVSRSMLAEDVAPNRLERAKAEIRDLLDLLDGDQVGLIAFAGRASVLSPLTPDFGFLRLALNDANPRSASRGGTRLEEPIRKAVSGFGAASEVSRSILLITDGEDHDSFPMEAAKEAAARGVRILAIGFGDEAGAPIPITDRETGARTFLADADGAPVTSRLDGDLLREMALLTNGAYVPAGTGLLDLESIYQRHIAPLTRGRVDGRTRTVRNDAFQWAVLLALACLLGAVMSTGRAAAARLVSGAGSTSLTVVVIAAALAFVSPDAAYAQAPAAGAAGPEGTNATEEADSTATEHQAEHAPGAAGDADVVVPEDPRLAYNEGVSKLQGGDVVAAARLLAAARDHSGADAETRFRATYNLGWTDVRAADALIDSEPAAALERLYRAAAWFREAITLRPRHDDARHNLEVVMRRALELSDSLAAGDDDDLLADLAALIEAQRGFLATLGGGVAAQQAVAGGTVTPELRRRFRSLAATELGVLADADALSDRAVQELEGIKSKAQDEAAPDEALRAAALEAAIAHLHRARERIAQARSRLRKSQGERAYRRAAAALGAFQRAQDQLLDPIARLDGLLAGGMEVAELTATKAALERGLAELDPESDAAMAAPAWLTARYLSENQQRLVARTTELHTGLAAGIDANNDAQDNAPAATPDAQSDAAAKTRLLEQLRAATPLIDDARQRFEEAASALIAERLNEALAAQGKALEALRAAREQFLDLRRLIELVYNEERRVYALIADPDGESDGRGEQAAAGESAPLAPADAAALGASLHERNVERTPRIGRMLSEAMTEAAQAASPASAKDDPGSTGTAPAASGQGGQLEQAYEHLRRAQDAMHKASRAFAGLAPGTSAGTEEKLNSPQAIEPVRASVDVAVTHLEALRRLFFSALEHLRDTARRQQMLADETQAVAALEDATATDSTARQAGPLGHRQGVLADTARGVSRMLSDQAAAPPQAEPAPGPDAERLGQAAELVSQSGETMARAAEQLSAESPALADARSAQDEALQALVEAIALLEQGQNEDQNEGQQEQNQQQQGQDEQAQGADKDEQQEQPQQDVGETDMVQLLQGVRDREARRREERGRQENQGYEPVDKDW